MGRMDLLGEGGRALCLCWNGTFMRHMRHDAGEAGSAAAGARQIVFGRVSTLGVKVESGREP